MSRLYINLNELPPEGRDVDGQIRQDIFGLDPSDKEAPRMISPVEYDLHVELDKASVLVSGSISTEVDLVCGRCLERFPWPVDLPDYLSEEPREGRVNLDLTELIREDILLSLPGYPHCEDSPLTPQHRCPAAHEFTSSTEFKPVSEEEASADRSRDAWSILDKLVPDDGSTQASPPDTPGSSGPTHPNLSKKV